MPEHVSFHAVAPWALLIIVSITALAKVYQARLRHRESMTKLQDEREVNQANINAAAEAARLDERKLNDRRFEGQMDRLSAELKECKLECQKCHQERQEDLARATAAAARSQQNFEERILEMLNKAGREASLDPGSDPGQPAPA